MIVLFFPLLSMLNELQVFSYPSKVECFDQSQNGVEKNASSQTIDPQPRTPFSWAFHRNLEPSRSGGNVERMGPPTSNSVPELHLWRSVRFLLLFVRLFITSFLYRTPGGEARDLVWTIRTFLIEQRAPRAVEPELDRGFMRGSSIQGQPSSILIDLI